MLMSFTGCGRFFTNDEIDPWVEPATIRVALADELYDTRKSTLRFDLFLVENLRISGGEVFTRFFGGGDSQAVANYVASGVKMIAPISSKKKGILLMNYGLAAYLDQLEDPSRTSIEWSRGKTLRADRPDNGLIVVLPGYFSASNVVRASLWPHERRHGDCPHPPTREETQRARRQVEAREDPDPSFNACGHQHVRCPSGHALADEFACDATEDGSYAYGREWARAVRDTCENCRGEMRTVAEALVIEYESRIVRRP